MKTKNFIAVMVVTLLLFNLKSIAQPVFPLINLLACDVDVAVEIGDASQCSWTPPNFVYTPCNNYTITIPATSTIWVNACSGIVLPGGATATGNLDELCVILLAIGGTPVLPSVHSSSGSACCLVPIIPFATGINPPGCGPVSWTMTRTLASWTIQ